MWQYLRHRWRHSSHRWRHSSHQTQFLFCLSFTRKESQTRNFSPICKVRSWHSPDKRRRSDYFNYENTRQKFREHSEKVTTFEPFTLMVESDFLHFKHFAYIYMSYDFNFRYKINIKSLFTYCVLDNLYRCTDFMLLYWFSSCACFLKIKRYTQNTTLIYL